MDNIETIIRNIRDDVDTRNYLLLLYYDMKERITKILYEVDRSKIDVLNVYELYTLKRKMSDISRPSSKYEYIIHMMLEQIESTLKIVDNTIKRFRSSKLRFIKSQSHV